MVHELVKSISIIVYEALCCKMFSGIFLKQRSNKFWYSLLSMTILTVCFVGIALSSYMQGEYIFRSIATMLIIFIVSSIFYVGKWMMKLFISVIFYGLLMCVDYCSFLAMEHILGDYIIRNDVAQVLLVLLCKTVFFVLILIVDFIWKKHDDMFYMKNGEWCLVLGFPLLTVMFIVAMLLTYQGEKNSIGYLVITIGLVIMNFIIFFLINYISIRERKLSQIQLLQERNKERMQAYQEISTNYQEQKRIIHDYNNQISCVQGLLNEGKYKEAKTYLTKFSSELQRVVENVDVNHPVLNVVLNQKYRQAREKGISILFLLNDLSRVWLEEQDIVILLSNLLDNAIEGCEKTETDKVIRFKLILEPQQMVLSVQNPFVENLVILEGDRVKTSKKDTENHGIGLQNVKMVIDKYQGMSGIHCEENWFYYTAVIPRLENV